jgi:hypothetical protein
MRLYSERRRGNPLDPQRHLLSSQSVFELFSCAVKLENLEFLEDGLPLQEVSKLSASQHL